jgi:2-alkyl-3-oxoalkanoate reductase
MRILVTGSNGFVGGALSRVLRARGHYVVGLGRAPSPFSSVDEYLCHDLARPMPEAPRVDAVVHAAALSSPWARPESFVDANVSGTRSVVDFCRTQAVGRLIYVSSSSVYYRYADQIGITEKTRIPAADEQINAYSRTKREGEEIVQRFGGSWCILRPRAVFGPGDTTLFPRLLRAAKMDRLPILRRPDGKKTVGDLIYIDTLTDYIVRALESDVVGDINLTNNEPVEIQSFLAEVLGRLGYPHPHRQIPVRAAMALARLAEGWSALFQDYKEPPITRFGVAVFAYSKTFDVSKCLRLLGTPSIGLEDGMRRFVDWWRSQRDA